MDPIGAILIAISLLCFVCCVWTAVRLFKDIKELAELKTIAHDKTAERAARCFTINAWAARDDGGRLFFYTEKPERKRWAFFPKEGSKCLAIDAPILLDLKWDDGAKEFEITFKEK